MSAICPDSAKAAPFRQVRGRFPCSNPMDRSSYIMAQVAPETISVPVDLLQALMEDASALSAKIGLLLEANDVEIAPATVLPDNVFNLSDYRTGSSRQAVSR